MEIAIFSNLAGHGIIQWLVAMEFSNNSRPWNSRISIACWFAKALRRRPTSFSRVYPAFPVPCSRWLLRWFANADRAAFSARSPRLARPFPVPRRANKRRRSTSAGHWFAIAQRPALRAYSLRSTGRIGAAARQAFGVLDDALDLRS